MKTQINYAALGVGVATILALSGCADSATHTEAAMMRPVGFWYGLWHGVILPFAWLASLFDSDVAIYATYNNGGWYDFGFIFGAGTLAGGSTSPRK